VPHREPVVLLPGMNCSELLWATPAETLRQEGYDVRVELLDGPDLDSCVAALLGRLPERFALAGLSLGGIVAMALRRVAPQRVTRLCLASTNARRPTHQQLAGWAAQRGQLAEGRTARDLQRDLLPLLVGEGAGERLVEATLRMADETGARRLDGQLRLQSSRVDECPGLEGVTVPTLVLAAAEDALCPVERHVEIHGLVEGSRLVVVDGAPHLSPLHQPPRVAEELSAWLRMPAVNRSGAAR
jgi:pimeloyl-ACP methyl ester carboxylesterase